MLYTSKTRSLIDNINVKQINMRSQAQLKRSALIRQCSPSFEDYMNQRLQGKTHKQIQNEKNDERTKK